MSLEELFNAKEKNMILSVPNGLGDCIKPGTKRAKERSHQNPCAHTIMRCDYTNKKCEELKEAIQPSPY
jgi:hypothetical protein